MPADGKSAKGITELPSFNGSVTQSKNLADKKAGLISSL